jgi:hypothetical protein
VVVSTTPSASPTPAKKPTPSVQADEILFGQLPESVRQKVIDVYNTSNDPDKLDALAAEVEMEYPGVGILLREKARRLRASNQVSNAQIAGIYGRR